MKAEIIAVGTELLLGQIVNTNAQYLSQECAAIGIDVYFQTVVGDNASRIREAIETARKRADLIIFTGGLGPTLDDLTKDVLADYLGRSLYLHEPSMAKINEIFLSRGAALIESNKRQANMIEGSDPLGNDTGLAVGNALTADGTHYILLPGPPKEMKPMFDNYAKRWLRGVMTDEVPLYSKMLKFAGIGESGLENKLIDLIEQQSDPTIAPYAKEGEVAIRLSSKADNEAEAMRKIAVVEAEIRSRVGDHLYADRDTGIETIIVEQLSERGMMLGAAESCTGGLLSEMVTSVPGSSQAFAGSIVCYTNAVKHEQLGVPTELLEGEGAPGAVSPETATVLAEQVLERLACDIAVSITGVAGPAPSENKPVGLVYIGLAQRGKPTHVITMQTSGNRGTVRLRAARHALYQVWRQLK